MLRPHTLLSWRQAILLGCAVLLISWLYTQSTAVDPQQHLNFVSTVRTIKQLDANVNQDVLRARYNLLAHYDTFVATLDQIHALARPLAREPFASYLNELDPGLKEAVRALNTAADAKAAQIERFKSRNAVFKNSLRYFPLASEQFIEHCIEARQTDLRREAEHLQRRVLVFPAPFGPTSPSS